MGESILNTIKKMLGLDPDYCAFDTDLIVLINSAIFVLTQVGVGPSNGFVITGSLDTWEEFLGDTPLFEAAKNYTFMSVKTVFDPPQNSFVMESYKKSMDELISRLNLNYEDTKGVEL